MLLNLSLAALLPLLTTLSLAQNDGPKAEARRAYDRGVTEYNLGRFDRAISEFERAYELDPAPMLLYNLAQAERRAGNLRRALFLYERFVKQAPTAENAANARRHIRDLAAATREEAQPAAPAAPEPAADPPAESSREAAPAAAVPDAAPQIERRAELPAVAAYAPAVPVRRMSIAAELGVSRLDFGRDDLREAVVVPVGASGQYRLRSGQTSFAVGLSFTGTRFHEADREGVQRAQHLFGLLASFGVGWPAEGRLSIGPELAAGIIWWTGLDDGNRFTLDGAGASGGPVPLPTLRIGLPIELGVSPSVVITIRPALAIARPGSGLRASIERVISTGVSAGAGVRF